MARPSPLMVRWKKYKQRGRKKRWGKQFVNKALGGPSPALMKQYGGLTSYRARGRFIGLNDDDIYDLCELWQLADFKMGDWKETGQPRLDVEIKVEALSQSAPEYRVLEFNYVYLREGDFSDVRLFFGGNEYFIVERKGKFLKRSIMYSSKDTAIKKFNQNKLVWAGTGIRSTSNQPP